MVKLPIRVLNSGLGDWNTLVNAFQILDHGRKRRMVEEIHTKDAQVLPFLSGAPGRQQEISMHRRGISHGGCRLNAGCSGSRRLFERRKQKLHGRLVDAPLKIRRFPKQDGDYTIPDRDSASTVSVAGDFVRIDPRGTESTSHRSGHTIIDGNIANSRHCFLRNWSENAEHGCARFEVTSCGQTQQPTRLQRSPHDHTTTDF